MTNNKNYNIDHELNILYIIYYILSVFNDRYIFKKNRS